MDDQQVLAALPGTTRDSFTAWVRPHWKAMARLAARLAPPGAQEDVLQDALAAAWRKRGQYDADRGSPQSWLLAVVADQSLKNRRRRRPILLDEPLERATDDALPDLDLRQAVTDLPPRQRLAVVLHYYLDLTVADAAAVMGCADGTVKSALADARRTLRRHLEES